MTNKTVSIIVPTKNSSSTLDACLRSIKEQTYAPIEIILVDNFSSDDTQEIAKQYTGKVFAKGPERCTQRNYGVDQSTGEYVAIIDSDMNLSPRVIEECVHAIEQAGAVGVIIPEESFGKGFWAQCKKLERSFYVGISYMEAARFFRKKDFQSVGGYDEDMVSGEDWDLSQRIEALGTITRVPSFIYHNEGRISLLKTIQKKYYYAQKFATYQKKNSDNKKVTQQTGIIGRYWLFLSRPGRLFRNPVLGIGMLFMKTCEFGFGALGYAAVKLRKG
ncbi:MAG: glycosyltransferase, group 2 family protein [Candidatus Saccharibacteria bacterium]|nr:glycosyltransferase, group 2 family protein [Candidatus Saccharibacteria bacterium]